MVHRLSCSFTCGIFLAQGLNLCLLHWQADSLPLSHQGSPSFFLFIYFWLRWVLLCAWTFSNCDEQGLLFIVVPRLLTAVSSLVMKHRL